MLCQQTTVPRTITAAEIVICMYCCNGLVFMTIYHPTVPVYPLARDTVPLNPAFLIFNGNGQHVPVLNSFLKTVLKILITVPVHICDIFHVQCVGSGSGFRGLLDPDPNWDFWLDPDPDSIEYGSKTLFMTMSKHYLKFLNILTSLFNGYRYLPTRACMLEASQQSPSPCFSKYTPQNYRLQNRKVRILHRLFLKVGLPQWRMKKVLPPSPLTPFLHNHRWDF